MKKIFLKLILFFMLIASILCFAGCKEEIPLTHITSVYVPEEITTEIKDETIDIGSILGEYAEGFSEFFELGPIFDEMHEDVETLFNEENFVITEDNLNDFSELNQIELTEEDFDKVNMGSFKGLYDQFKDKINVYYNTSENLYIADIRTEKTPIEINCEYVEENDKEVYKYEIKYENEESVYEDVYEGEGVILLLISDSSCMKIDEENILNKFAGENKGA